MPPTPIDGLGLARFFVCGSLASKQGLQSVARGAAAVCDEEERGGGVKRDGSDARDRADSPRRGGGGGGGGPVRVHLQVRDRSARCVCENLHVSHLTFRATSGAYRAGVRQAEVAQSAAKWVTGAAVLERSPEDWVAQYGPKIIHQSWKTARSPLGQMTANFVSWSRHHPEALHVLWTDEDNRAFMRRFYPEFEATYWSPLLTNVQRADLARVLYLHRYGGLYADLDYEARANVFEALPKTAAKIFVVK